MISHTMNIWEIIIERRLRGSKHGEEQFDFMPGRGTTGAHLQRGKVVEKHREIQRDLHMMFIDLHKPLKARGRVSAIGSLEVFEGPGCT